MKTINNKRSHFQVSKPSIQMSMNISLSYPQKWIPTKINETTLPQFLFIK